MEFLPITKSHSQEWFFPVVFNNTYIMNFRITNELVPSPERILYKWTPLYFWTFPNSHSKTQKMFQTLWAW